MMDHDHGDEDPSAQGELVRTLGARLVANGAISWISAVQAPPLEDERAAEIQRAWDRWMVAYLARSGDRRG